jgi:hypothetical protein
MNMRRLMLSSLLILSACAPPALPVESTEPSVAVLWPQDETLLESCAMVVVKIDHLTLVDPGTAPPVTEGQGHFHIEFPGNYNACYKPYCLVDLSSIAPTDGSEITPTLTAVLTDNAHVPLTHADGSRIEDSVPIRLKAGDCTEGTPTGGYDDTGMTGMGDSGDSG